MFENTGDEVHCGFAEAQFCVGVIERVFAVFHQRHVGVHTGTVDAVNGLRHERCVQAVTASIGFNNMFKGNNVVCGFQRFVKTEVDFVLTLCHFVVGSFNFKAHFFQRQADIAAALFALVGGTHIEIARNVAGLGGRVAFFIQLEQEEFTFRTDVERIAHVCGFFNDFFQNVSRVAEEWGFAVCAIDVANHARNAVFPRQDDERIIIRAEIHVGFIDTNIALNRGTVEHAFIVQCFFELALGNRNIFQLTENIRELQTDKLHIFFFCDSQNIFFGVTHLNDSLQK